MIEHVHGRSEQHTLIGLAGTPRDDFGEKRFPDAGVADYDNVGAMVDEVEIHQVKDAALHLKTAFVMVEREAIDRATHRYVQSGNAARQRGSGERPVPYPRATPARRPG